MATKFNNMKKYPIYNADEECKIFISFNSKNNDLMLSWTIKSISNIINALNMRSYGRFQKTLNTHKNKMIA
jgi:nitrate reductase NapAB chaperone NapD